MKLLAIPASLRSASLNRKLLACCVQSVRSAAPDATVEVIDLRDFALPPYDGDIEEGEGIPDAAAKLGELISACDGILIACPEYNNSISGTFKNVIDWVSRLRPVPLRDKSALLMSASPGLVGGNRGLWALRVPLELLGVHVYPGMFSMSGADKGFEEDGSFSDKANEARLSKLTTDFLSCLQRVLD